MDEERSSTGSPDTPVDGGSPNTALIQSLPGIGLALGAGVGIAVGVAIAGGPGIAIGAAVGAGLGLVGGAIGHSLSTSRSPSA